VKKLSLVKGFKSQSSLVLGVVVLTAATNTFILSANQFIDDYKKTKLLSRQESAQVDTRAIKDSPSIRHINLEQSPSLFQEFNALL